MVWNRKVAIGVVVVVVIGLLAYGFWPEATLVTVEQATRDSMRVTVEEEGQTQLRERYVVSAPTTGYLKRVPVTLGDRVQEGEVIARLAALPSRILEASGYQEAEAQMQAAGAALRRAEAQAEAAEATFERAEKEFEQIQRLHKQGTASAQELETAQAEFRQARAQYQAAQAAVEQARQELQAARSRLNREVTNPEALGARVTIEAPVDGRIMQIQQESAGVVQGGTPLFTLGNLDSLEVTADVLSSDAVRMSAGLPVEFVRWGGDQTLHGTVRVVAPGGHTEVSALGVEQQRVEVLSDFATLPPGPDQLGAGYRVVARYILWSEADVLQVPQSALFRHDGGWAVFVMQGGRAQLQPVQVGHRSGLQAQVTDGLSAGTSVITHPGNELSDGMRVEAR